MNTEIVKIIEAGLSRDRSTVIKYSQQLVKNLQVSGEERLAKRINELLENKARDFVSLEELSSIPVDMESRIEIADVYFSNNEDTKLVLSPMIERQIDLFVNGIKNNDKILNAGFYTSKSLLLYGAPGCGKSSIGQLISQRLELPLVVARLDSLVSSLLGSTSKNIKKLFDYANNKSCILFLDEFDAIAKARDDHNEQGELKRVVNSLLQNIDVYTKDNILIAATNHHELLDRAVWRRFSTVIHIMKPNECDRIKMLKLFINSYPTDFEQDERKLERIIILMNELSPSDIRTIINNCVRNSIIQNKNILTYEDVLLELFIATKGKDYSDENAAHFLNSNGITQENTRKTLGLSIRQIRKILSTFTPSNEA